MSIEELVSRQKQLAETIERILINFKKDSSTRKTPEYLAARKNDLEKYWKDFTSCHKQITEIATEEHPYLTQDLYGKTQTIFHTAAKLIAEYPVKGGTSATKDAFGTDSTQYEKMNLSTTATPNYQEDLTTRFTEGTQQAAPSISYLEANKLNNLPKLPPIKIPKFNGDYKEWKPFIDIFTNVIDANPYISNVEKMQYLLYHLEGDARKVISHLQLSNNNYRTALHLVQARFNNTRKIITTYINTIIDAKKVEYRSQEDIILLYDIIKECLEALNNLDCHTDEWGPIIVCIALRKLDSESLRLFEESLLHPREMPSTSELLNFLEKRYQVLDCIKSSRQTKNESIPNKRKTFHATLKPVCLVCKENHKLYQCTEFKKMNVKDRQSLVMQRNLCTNCLAHKKTEQCKTTKSCFHCKKKHHTLLHQSNEGIDNKNSSLHTVRGYDGKKEAELKGENVLTLHNKTKIPNVLLPTAMVRTMNIFGQTELLRALIDPGSQVSLITEEVVQNLRLQKERMRTTILGVGEAKSSKSHSKVSIKIELRYPNRHYLQVDALVLPKLNSMLPDTPVKHLDLSKYGDIILADPTFNRPGPIDVLLGADVYAKILLDGLKPELPTAQNTKLGWILFGNMPNTFQETNKVATFLSIADIEQKLEQFWEVEERAANDTSEADICTEHFAATHQRDQSGRYIVSLPFKENTGQLGHSKNKAVARLIQLEKRLKKSPEDMTEYNRFLTEYLALGHMSLAKPYTGDVSKVYYLPHHSVIKKESTTTQLRVVFDASCKTESGLSLNDTLHKGEKIQQDLNQMLLRWRKYRYVFSADIEKMFRQIKIAQRDRNYQRILWRQNPNDPIQEFVLNTVTYGTAPATYLAVKTLQQLAKDEGNRFPVAKPVLERDFYIDDMLTGADTKLEAQQLQSQIISLLANGGFNLRKWTSNKEELLRDIPEEIIEKGILEIGENDTIKTLGIHWSPKQDEFHFKLKLHDTNTTLTKRELLTRIASIFDPLGWLAPITITAKLMMQAVWKAGSDWDDVPPAEISNAWKKLETEMQELRAVRIPRWINYRSNQKIQLHGFCDASEKAYAAVIYSRTTDSFGKVHTTLLTAKTKVAPLKQKISIPRLELCGALLMVQLLKATIDTLDIASKEIFAWCDSEIVLAWIAKNPNNWNTFTANRVSQIQNLFDKSIWRHVPSADNPADVASRGINPKKLVSYNIWWRGPLWLSKEPNSWPTNRSIFTTNAEIKKTVTVFKTTISSEPLLTCSSYTKQIRIIAYCLRFIKNSKTAKGQRKTEFLSSSELHHARDTIIKIVQMEEFSEEISSLKGNRPLKKGSKLLSLNPYIDSAGLLRVGGRLENSHLSVDAKHQILLPQKHHVTNIIIEHAHQQTLHGGTQLTLNYIRTQFWIIDGKRVVQGRNHKCIKCTRYRQQPNQTLMGNLPAARITPSPPFTHCGIDYAGPFLTKASKGRGTKSLKGYIALFICMVTKAVHLELVTDLTTDAFLAAYRRFVSRRGHCKQIFSDNGTNFVGARNKMDKDLKLAISHSTRQAAETIANDGTDWKFIPVASPHFGGLWEAGVKSVKKHLKRVLGETLLTYKEFSTLLCQVEACLNSRPIGQHSSDPNDLEPLTPGHFLIGRPLIAPPEPIIEEKQIYQRWKLVTKLQQDLWKKWSQEYLCTLQQRSKWTTEGKNPAIGELVLVKEDNLPPQKWSLGRIMKLHPGDDGIVRIVSVKYKNDIKKRPINKICQLPITTLSTESENPEYKAITAMKLKRQKASSSKSVPPGPELWSKPEHFDRITTTQTKRKGNSTQTTFAKKRKIAPCTWASRLLHSTLLLFYWLTIAFAQDYEIFHPKSGFYVEDLGNVQVKRGNLRLQLTFPIEEIINDQKRINTTWEQINNVCRETKKLTDITHCQVLFQHLSIKRTNLLRSTNEMLQLVEDKNRSKRGLLGKLLTGIFGVNDDVYTDIEVLQRNQQNLQLSTNQQVLLLNTRINQSNFFVKEKLKQFDARLAQVIKSINDMASWYTAADHNRISIEVLSAYLSAEDYYEELHEKYNNWINAVHNTGHILNFLTAQDIGLVIQNVSLKLGSNLLILPTPQNRLDVKKENNTIKLHGYLNIVERSTYDLIHVTPIPHLIAGNKFAVAELKISTIAVNFNEQAYFNLEQKELKSCSKTRGHIYLCSPTITHSIEDNPSCAIDEIYDRQTKTKCEIREISLSGIIWQALVMKNTWLYMTSESKAIAIICKGSRKELLLNNTGIIHLEGDCYIKTKEITLKTALDETADVIANHMKEVPLSTTAISPHKPPSVLKSGALIRPDEHILDYSVEPELHHTILRKTLVIHSVAATTTLLLIILVMLLIRYWSTIKRQHRLCCNQHHREHTPTGQPPTSANQESIQQHFDRVLSSRGPQHVHTLNNN